MCVLITYALQPDGYCAISRWNGFNIATGEPLKAKSMQRSHCFSFVSLCSLCCAEMIKCLSVFLYSFTVLCEGKQTPGCRYL
jgi:hypothetical protein